jgi:HK97 family phage portal protein
VAFVVTSGEVQAVQRAPGAWFGPSVRPTVAMSGTLALTYEALWRAQPALRTTVGFLARNVAQLGLDPYRRISDNDRKKLTDHPLARMLEQPLPINGSKWTKYRLLSTLVHDLCVYDNAFWLKMRIDGTGDVNGLLPVPPRMIFPRGVNWFAADEYRLYGNAGYQDIPADDVVHFHGYNPDDPRQGVSPIETLRQILAEEFSAATFREQMWRNGARVAGYIKRPATSAKWSDTARERFRGSWQAQYAGDGPATGGTPVLEDGMEFMSAGVTPRDAQYVESRKLTREEVAVAFYVSPVMLGVMEGATFSSMTELHKMLYQDTLAPMLAQIAQDVECQLLPDLDPSAKDGSVYVEFNLSEKLRGSFEQQASAIQSSVGGPWMTRGEARAMFNLPHIDGDEELITPLNVITGGLASPNDTAPNSPDNGPSNGQPPKAAPVVRACLKRQQRVTLAHVGANTPGVWFDAGRWNDELTADLDAAGVPSARKLAELVNGRTAVRVAAAFTEPDPIAAVQDAFTARLEDEG